MGQIVKRKKKGRPSRTDLARRSLDKNQEAAALDRRRSLRRRNVRYENFIDYDDYLDEFEGMEIEEMRMRRRRRKEKKLKLVLLNKEEEGAAEHAVVSPSSSSEEEEECLKKRKITNDGSEEDDSGSGDQKEGTERMAESMGHDSVPVMSSDHRQNGLPLPDNKLMELILNKLQKKDTYGVYAEPVDLEELPDYLDVIDQPMDFATIRKKLGNGSYLTLEQFESDVFLICSNAMQYNASETIYHKQACAIEELARKKFQKLRIDNQHTEKELKSENKTTSNFLAKEPLKKPVSRTKQEPVGSDLSSGPTLATAGDAQNGSVTTQAGGCERPSNADVLVEGSSSLVDTLEKAEDLPSGKGNPSKFGRKAFLVDENRRATYNISDHPVVKLESIVTIFEGEIKQLVAVGLYAEYSYPRSLARFAASLGPVAWKAASQRIEQALPLGCKFGCGWVGEYEPLPMPVLMLENTLNKSFPFMKSQCTAKVQEGDISSRTCDLIEEHPTREPNSEGMPPFCCSTVGSMAEEKPSFFSSTGKKPSTNLNLSYKQQKLPSMNISETSNKALKQAELNLPPSSFQNGTDTLARKKLQNNSERRVSRPREMSTVAVSPVASEHQEDNGVGSAGLPNGNMSSISLNNRMISSSSSVSNEIAKVSYLRQGFEQGLADPVEAMKISAEKAQKQQKPSNQCFTGSPSSARHDSGSGAAAVVNAWMPIGAVGFKPPIENSAIPSNHFLTESLCNSSQLLYPKIREQFPPPAGVQFQFENKNFPSQAFIRPHVLARNAGQMQNLPMLFPRAVATDLPRLQARSPWQGQSAQSQKKQEKQPPDLNIGVQSPGSPVKQSSGVRVDLQLPDLALQL